MNVKIHLEPNSSKVNNPESEQDSHADSWLHENQRSPYKPFSQDNQESINLNHRITSLYFIIQDNKRRNQLLVYDTENKTKELITLDTPQPLGPDTCITLLPNGELFCFGSSSESGLALIIDNKYEVRALPSPSGIFYYLSSAICFNNNMYCFGGRKNTCNWGLSSKFDFNENRWINLAPMPSADLMYHSVIFNENILISGRKNTNLLLYTIDINSFSTISYSFAKWKRKILINAEERVYLIECGKVGKIYKVKQKMYILEQKFQNQ